MPIDPSFFNRIQWAHADELRVSNVKGNGDVERDKTKVIPSGSDTLEIQVNTAWLFYRLTDSNGVIHEAGMYPAHMVVSIISTA